MGQFDPEFYSRLEQLVRSLRVNTYMQFDEKYIVERVINRLAKTSWSERETFRISLYNVVRNCLQSPGICVSFGV